MKRHASTMLVAGRILPKNSPCTSPAFSQSSMCSTKSLVRTTLANPAPPPRAPTSRCSRPETSAPRRRPPDEPAAPIAVAVVPETYTKSPRQTVRDQPTLLSHIVPLVAFSRLTEGSSDGSAPLHPTFPTYRRASRAKSSIMRRAMLTLGGSCGSWSDAYQAAASISPGSGVSWPPA